MVLGVCRRVLRDRHDAEDAFQATFLVLARKAASVLPREKLGNWLYGVASQTARKARAAHCRRRAREKQVPEMSEPEGAREDHRDDLLPLLDQELGRLPERYRVPIVLSDLGGKSHKQAAEELGWPVGTVSGRLSRARATLAERLTRRGVTLAGGSLIVLLSRGSASAGVPMPLVTSTARAATRFAAGRAATGVVSAKVAALTEGVLKMMLLRKLKIATAVLMAALGAAGAGSSGLIRWADASSPARGIEGPGPAAGGVQARGVSDRRDGPGPGEELKGLEGTWAITDGAEGGTWATPEQKANGIGTVVIKGDRLTVFTATGLKPGYSFTIDVDPSQDPRIMGLLPLDEKLEVDRRKAIWLGSYERKGGTLTICYGVDRPDNFEVPPGSQRGLFVLKRARR